MSTRKIKLENEYIKIIDGIPHMRVRIVAERAMFTNPLFTEKISYDVVTPSALQHIIGSIYWHPGCNYVVDAIHVMKPIKKDTLKVNFVDEKIKAETLLKTNGSIDSYYIDNNMQIIMNILVDIEYVIDFHIEIGEGAHDNDNVNKFAHSLARRFISGETYLSPHAGMNRFPCDVIGVKNEETIEMELGGNKDLGLIFYGWEVVNNKKRPIMCHMIMDNGIINMTNVPIFSISQKGRGNLSHV